MEKETKKEEHHVKRIEPQSKPQDTKTIVMMVMLGLLVLVSLVQAVELMGLKEKLSDETLTVSSSSAKTAVGTSAGSGSGALSKNLESLPSMVGGC